MMSGAAPGADADVEEAAEGLLGALQADDNYREFFADEFDASRYANNIIQGSSIAASLRKLSEGVHKLEDELHSQVVAHHEDLLTQATGIEKLEDVLKMVTSRVQALQKSAERIRTKIDAPYQKLVTRNAQLFRLQEACEILRRTLRFLYYARRLKEQLRGGAREIPKAAHTLNEIDGLTEDMDLTGVDVVDAEMGWIFKAKEDLLQQTGVMLTQGMESHNQAQVATALQVFWNLNRLESEVDKVVSERLSTLAESYPKTLDLASIAMEADPSTQDTLVTYMTPAIRATFWTRVDKMINTIYTVSAQVRHLQRMLAKKRDPNSQQTFADLLTTTEGNTAHRFWLTLTESFKDSLRSTCNHSPPLKKAFEVEFAKLLRMVNDLWARTLQYHSHELTDDLKASELSALRRCLSEFETAYLSGSMLRMFDPVHLVFPEGGHSPPSAEEVTSICKVVQQPRSVAKELEVSLFDESLAVAVAKNVAKTVKLYLVRSEAMQATDKSATQIYGTCSLSLKRNIQLVNRLHEFRDSTRQIVSAMAQRSQAQDTITQVVEAALKDSVAFEEAVVSPLVDAMTERINEVILRMHEVNYAGNKERTAHETPDEPCSQYIQVLQDDVLSFSQEILSKFYEGVLAPHLTNLMSSMLNKFVTQACLISALGEAGKLRLAADMAQLELAVSPLQVSANTRVSEVGAAYKALRAFRPLLFLSPEQVAEAACVGRTLPVSTVALHLLSRSPEIQSPHLLLQWGVVQFENWLLSHPEPECREKIMQSLEVYAQGVMKRGERQFVPVYPVIKALLERP